MNVLPYQQSDEGCRLEGTRRWDLHLADVRVGLQVSRSRRVPWLWIARVPRFGRDIPADRRGDVIRRMVQMAHEHNVLRLHVEIWTENADDLQALQADCEASGLLPATHSRSYTHTVWIDLSGREEDLLSRFHSTCRQNIRAPAKKGYYVRKISNVDLAPQLEAIFLEAFKRTGGNPPEVGWTELIRQAAVESSDINLVGLFAADDTASARPLAFAAAVLHGDVAEYAHAGSIRDPLLKVPLLYAPTWELMRWARARGATAWDFGGVAGSDAPDARSGIDRFKFLFSEQIMPVGAEWVLQCSRLPWPFRLLARTRSPRRVGRVI